MFKQSRFNYKTYIFSPCSNTMEIELILFHNLEKSWLLILKLIFYFILSSYSNIGLKLQLLRVDAEHTGCPEKCIRTLAADKSIVCFFFISFLWGYLKDKVYAMRPATILNMNVRKYQGNCFVMCAIPLLRVVSSDWTRTDVTLRTGDDKTIK